jgi:hypothetical protein
MQDVPFCPGCGVPGLFIENYRWLSSGAIVQSSDQEHRMVIMDCDNLDPFFKKIGEIIGKPIEQDVIETKMKATRDYLKRLIPEGTKEAVRSGQMDMENLIELVDANAHVMGYGDSKFFDLRLDNGDEDFVIEHISEPYSILLFSGDLAGSCEILTSRGQAVSYRHLSPNLYEVKTWPSNEPRRMRARLEHERYVPVEGDVTLERCPECGGPAALSSYHWDMEKGQIVVEETGRRVAMLGPAYIETVFRELEVEFGEDIPRVIVEAQRRFTRKGIYATREMGDGDSFRKFLALRGLGELQEIKLRRNGLEMRLKNPTLSLILAGILQGYYEYVTDSESDIDWWFDEDGTFEMKVTARTPICYNTREPEYGL